MARDNAREPTRSSGQPTVIKHLPQRTGLGDGPERHGNGEIRRRSGRAVYKPGRSTKGLRTDQPNNGRSLKAICADLNLTLKGWYEYFEHSAPHVFEAVDGHVRGRLRNILRRQNKRKGW